MVDLETPPSGCAAEQRTDDGEPAPRHQPRTTVACNLAYVDRRSRCRVSVALAGCLPLPGFQLCALQHHELFAAAEALTEEMMQHFMMQALPGRVCACHPYLLWTSVYAHACSVLDCSTDFSELRNCQRTDFQPSIGIAARAFLQLTLMG